MNLPGVDGRVARVIALAIATVLTLVLAADWYAAGSIDSLLSSPLKLGGALLAGVAYMVLSVTADSAFAD